MAKSRQKTVAASVFTIGYEGRAVDSFIASLKQNNIEVLVDVRQRASSRKPAFNKTALSELLEANGIEYRHLPQLGTPAELRSNFRSGEIELADYLKLYGKYLDTRAEQIEHLTKLVHERQCCLLCVEADHRTCHRSVLARAVVAASDRRLTVRHLSI